jgi:hypothetical protein
MVDLFDETCNGDPAATLVSYPQVESGMQRAKRMQNPKIPASTLEFEELLQRHQDLGLYYRGSVWSGERSAVIFASEEASAKLSAGQIVEIQFDGKFITAPEPYKQTWTITGVYNAKVIPFVTVLMTGRTKSLYKAVLTELKVLYPNSILPTQWATMKLVPEMQSEKYFPKSPLVAVNFTMRKVATELFAELASK